MFFLIRYQGCWFVFDTGNNAMVAKDPNQCWGEEILKKLIPDMKEEEEFLKQLKKFGVVIKDIQGVIISHSHADHAGAIDHFRDTGIPICFQGKELEQVLKNLESGMKTYGPLDSDEIRRGLNLSLIDGVYDLFGNGEVVIFPTPGHTLGHQSLMIKRKSQGPLIFCADACYTMKNLEQEIPQGLTEDMNQHVLTLRSLKVMKMMGAEIIPGHDLAYFDKRPMAPDSIFTG